MEQYYYNHMDKQKQAAYHGILQGITSLADEIQSREAGPPGAESF